MKGSLREGQLQKKLPTEREGILLHKIIQVSIFKHMNQRSCCAKLTERVLNRAATVVQQCCPTKQDTFIPKASVKNHLTCCNTKAMKHDSHKVERCRKLKTNVHSITC